MKQKNPKVVIAGAGIAGCFLALKLAQRGIKVEIFEKDTKNEAISAASKRSFNITLYGFGLGLLKDAGLLPDLKNSITKLKGSVTFIGNNAKPVISYVNNKTPYYAVQRADLLKVLMNKAQATKNVKVYFEHELVTAYKTKKIAVIKNSKTSNVRKVQCDLVVGCDGVNSKVRELLQKEKKATLSKKYSHWKYKQIIFSKEDVKALRMNTKYAYTWSSKKATVATFPNKDASCTAMLILPQKSSSKQDIFANEMYVSNLIKKGFPSLIPALLAIISQAKSNPAGSFVTVHTSPWQANNFLIIMGDAAHGFYPFFGQGISAALGDANEFVSLFDKNGRSIEKIMPIFELNRKRHMDTLGELSKEGFELYRRHKKANYKVIYNKIETILHTFLPTIITPSVFEMINKDPGKTDDYVKKHSRQRKFARFVGIPGFILLFTSFYAIFEIIITQKWLSSFNARTKNFTLAQF